MEKETRNIATMINNGEVHNLADVDWKEETNWNENTAEAIIEQIDDNAVKAAVLDCMVGQWSYKTFGWSDGWFGHFGEFCSKYKQYIQNYGLYNIESIKARADKAITDLQQKVAALENVIAPHYSSPQTKEELTAIFERLKKGGYFDAEADLQTWLYICTGDQINGCFKPLNWIKDNGLLAHLITAIFVNDNLQWWSTAEKCFKVRGKQPNSNTLKTLNSTGYKANNRKHNELERLLRGNYTP